MKGGDFERDISKALSKWLNGTEKPYQYWRMPGSGGLATIHEECRGLSGDIRALTPEAEFLTDAFSIECKTGYPRTTFWQVFKDIRNFSLRNFWKQCTEDACGADKMPMLIYRKLRERIILGIAESDNKKLERSIKQLKKLPVLKVRFNTELPMIAIYDFEEFFRTVSPAKLKKFVNG